MTMQDQAKGCWQSKIKPIIANTLIVEEDTFFLIPTKVLNGIVMAFSQGLCILKEDLFYTSFVSPKGLYIWELL